jgi:pyridoxal/pyridoxine/pyridoxamine kinase
MGQLAAVAGAVAEVRSHHSNVLLPLDPLGAL